jgi:large subunit ribosomal protein L23
MEKLNRTLGDLLLLIKCPLITEKSVNVHGNGHYTFLVDKSMTKIEIKYAFEKIFNIKIIKIGTLRLPIKTKKVGKFIGKKASYKKTYIKLENGYSINNLFD